MSKNKTKWGFHLKRICTRLINKNFLDIVELNVKPLKTRILVLGWFQSVEDLGEWTSTWRARRVRRIPLILVIKVKTVSILIRFVLECKAFCVFLSDAELVRGAAKRETNGRGRLQSQAQARGVKAGQRPSCCYRTNRSDHYYRLM